MKKKKANKSKHNEESFQMNEVLNENVLAKLKNVKKEMKEQEQVQEAARRELEKKRRIEKEKNKSFEELLGESSLDWKNFK